ncbi:hypothetical protein O7625_11895 [Micromonospora sp. WMMD714]|nr:hypothetical protein [Micromonospora sp. WMMD714]WFE63932.1 hypothetical protein O7625_11895 [Micromonospora sp. WMMD714]
MIERGGGRTSGLTDWHLMDVLSMWACLQDQETQGHWKHVAGWRKVCDLAQTHLRRLQQYRSGLAEAWPPATNAAARTYLGELDELIGKVQRTHDTAAANHDALAAAARAIDSARPEIKRLHDDYARQLHQKRGYEATLADPRAAAGSRVVDPPVTDADLEKLNTQARGIMFGLSGELQQAQSMLQKPPVARPVPKVDDETRPFVAGGEAGPLIPPIVPTPIAITPETKRSSSPNRATLPSGISDIGPTLGGAGSATSPPTATPTPPNASPASPPPGNLGPMPSGSPIGQPQMRHPSGTPTHKRFPITGIKGGPSPELPRPTPPGGIIGGTPGVNLGPLNSTPSPRRVNPIGGIIGGGSAGTAPTGAAGTRPGIGRSAQPGGLHGLPPIGGAPTFGTNLGSGIHGDRNHRRGSSEPGARCWDVDNPWGTDKGVPPIVLPPEDEGPIDPGPTIGINR